MRVGVVISRFQVPHLHEAHKMLINYVQSRNQEVVILLGTTQARLTHNNPLNYEARRAMVLDEYPGVKIFPLADQKDDAIWSQTIDVLIGEKYPDENVVLYGGRNSFIGHYTGIHRTEQMQYEMTNISGTLLRKGYQLFQENTMDWRKGVIHASTYRYPVSFQTVDIAIVSTDNNSILLGRKMYESKYRFIGGFVSPEDASLEAAARREVTEECGSFEMTAPKYIDSVRIDDWRYRKEQDKILTAFFYAEFKWGMLKAGDDIHELKWMPVNKFDKPETFIEPEHLPLVKNLKDYIPKLFLDNNVTAL